MPANTMKVDRTTRFGNPFTPTMLCVSNSKVHEHGKPIGQAGAVKAFDTLMATNLRLEPAKTRALLEQLRGRNLACWCKLDEPCHADVLLRLANEGVEHSGFPVPLTANASEPVQAG